MELNRSRRVVTLAASAALLLASCASMDQDGQSVLMRADKAMGGSDLRTLRYTATGTGATFGQAYVPGQTWPRINIPSFSREIDYGNGAMREESVRNRAEPGGGGAIPLMGAGEQRTHGLVRGEYAWNMAGTAANAAPLTISERTHDLWITPHGVIKAGLKNKGRVRSDGAMSAVSFSEPGRFRAVAFISSDGMVERVESVHPNPVMGDTRVITRYMNYRDHGGVKFPSRIVQEQGGFPVLDLTVGQVQPNAPVAVEVLANVPTFAERVASEKAADGVWHLAGGSHNSVLIEMKDHLILVESPLYDGRALAVIAEAKRLAPGKPIRYVINSHHHFDHSGGLRAAVSEGATLVTSEQARPWFEQVMANPNSIRPDAMQTSGRRASVMGVSGERTFSDGDRTVRVYLINDSIHANGFVMVWLPKERLLVEADAYTPAPPNTPPPAVANVNNVNLADNIQRLRLDVDRILPLHGRIVPLSELYTAIGRRP